MQCAVYNLEKKEVGKIEFAENIFDIDIRQDLIKLVIDWQLAKRQAGTHKTKNISEISGTTKKPWKQKGTGRARAGSLRSVQMRGGAISHGSRVRSHAFDLTKKVRRLGMMHALASKFQENNLFIVKDLALEDSKTKTLSSKVSSFGYKSYFVIDNETVDTNFALACKNLFNINVVPQIGANVYDIIKHECTIITENALQNLLARLVA